MEIDLVEIKIFYSFAVAIRATPKIGAGEEAHSSIG